MTDSNFKGDGYLEEDNRFDGYTVHPCNRNTFAISNRKGGVSKTTTSVNMASILAEMKYRVLLIDLDSQANATMHMGLIPNNLDYTTYDLMSGKAELEECIVHTTFGVDVVGSSNRLQNIEVELHSTPARDSVLKRAIDKANLDYDFIILDLAPDLSLSSINGLVASSDVIVPIDVGMFSINAINDITNNINLIRDSGLNESVGLMGILITKLDNRTNIAKEVPELLRDTLQARVFDTEIKQNISLMESQNVSMPINHYAPSSSGYFDYYDFVKEVLNIVNK